VTVKLELKPEIEAGLIAQAQARGLSLESYLDEVLQSAAIECGRDVFPAQAEAIQRAKDTEEGAESHHSRRPHQSSDSAPSASEPFWKSFTRRVHALPDTVFERLPQDGASEHDHYLYCAPKRNA
jgi:hypothetical protein